MQDIGMGNVSLILSSETHLVMWSARWQSILTVWGIYDCEARRMTK